MLRKSSDAAEMTLAHPGEDYLVIVSASGKSLVVSKALLRDAELDVAKFILSQFGDDE